jgi:hypothetical protein
MKTLREPAKPMSVRRAVIGAVMLAAALGALAGPVAAEGLESKWRSACWRDAFTICTLKAISNDRAGVRDCLVRNIERISKPCRTVIEEAHDQGIRDVRPPDEPVASAATPAPR